MDIGSYPTDLFDLLPDPIILLILNRVSDVKSLLRCAAASRRLSALAPLSDSLLLRVDRVVAPSPSLSLSLLQSLLRILRPDPTRPENSPARILRRFPALAALTIELPAAAAAGGGRPSVNWVARFGRSLRSCAILISGGSGGGAAAAGVKGRVASTITALIAASARHHMVADVVAAHPRLSRLVVSDRDGEGAVIMDDSGLREFRAAAAAGGGGGCRPAVPAVVMRMRHEARLELSGGAVVEGATLVVVRPAGSSAGGGPDDDVALAAEAFGGGVFKEHVEKLLKSRSYILEMNSF